MWRRRHNHDLTSELVQHRDDRRFDFDATTTVMDSGREVSVMDEVYSWRQ